MAHTNAFRIADYIIAYSHEHGDPVSNLKLQKLLYYAQAWFLALYDERLFDERIEAWVHGPAVPPVYRQYKTWAWQPIAENPDYPDLDKTIVEHLDEVLDVYGDLTGPQLHKLTHSEDPWKNARGDLPLDQPSSNPISDDDMREFYRALASNVE